MRRGEEGRVEGGRERRIRRFEGWEKDGRREDEEGWEVIKKGGIGRSKKSDAANLREPKIREKGIEWLAEG